MNNGNGIVMPQQKEALINERVRVRAQATEMLAMLLDKRGVSPQQLAKSLGKRPLYVKRVLAGTEEIDLEDLAGMFFLLGKSLHLYVDRLGTRHYPQEQIAE